MSFGYLTSDIAKSLIGGKWPQELLERLLEQNPSSLRNDSAIQFNLKFIACFFLKEHGKPQPLYGRVKNLLGAVDSSIWDLPQESAIHVEKVMHTSSNWLDVDPMEGQNLEKQVKKMHGKDEMAMTWLLAQTPVPLNLWEGVLNRASKWTVEDRVWLLKECEKVNHWEGQSLRHYIRLLVQTEEYSKQNLRLVEELAKISWQALMPLLPCIAEHALETGVLSVLDKRLAAAKGKERYALMELLFKQDERWWPWERLQESLIETPREVSQSLLQSIKKNLAEKTFVPLYLSIFAEAVIHNGQSLSRKSLLELLIGIKNNDIIERAFQCLQGKQVLDKVQVEKLLLTTLELKAPGSHLLNLVSEWLLHPICNDCYDKVYPLFLFKLFDFLSMSPDYLYKSIELERSLPQEIGRMMDYTKFTIPDTFGRDPEVISPQVMINSALDTLRFLMSANDKNKSIKDSLNDLKSLKESGGVKVPLRNKKDKVQFLEILLKIVPKEPHVQTFFSLYARMLAFRWMKQRVLPHDNNLLNFRVSFLPVYPLPSLGLIQKIGFYVGYNIEKQADPRWRQTKTINTFLMTLFVEIVGSYKSGKYDEQTANMIHSVVAVLLECKAFHGILIANWTVNHYAIFFTESQLDETKSRIRAICRHVLANVWHDKELIEKYCALDTLFADEKKFLQMQLEDSA